MLLQLLSDLHLETESFDPQPAAGAELLVLAGDIDATWQGYQRFANWPVPVIVVAGNHEFDRRDIVPARAAFDQMCRSLGFIPLECEEHVHTARDGRQIRFLGTTRWSDFDLLGEPERARAQKAAGYFQRVMAATRHGQPFDAPAVREEALQCRAWLERMLVHTQSPAQATVVITHFGPSLRSADPRYGAQPGTASFCNADDDLIGWSDLWLHGHLHVRHDYSVSRAAQRPPGAPSRVVCQARGLARKGEAQGHDPLRLIQV